MNDMLAADACWEHPDLDASTLSVRIRRRTRQDWSEWGVHYAGAVAHGHMATHGAEGALLAT